MRIKKYDEGLSGDVVRELECQKVLSPEYVVRMLDYFSKDGTVVLVYEYMPSDLQVLLSALAKPLFDAQIKSIIYMVLRGVQHCHHTHIMHRVGFHHTIP